MLPISSSTIGQNDAVGTVNSVNCRIAKEFVEEGWQVREFVEKDLDEVCALCRAAFPLDYPQSWYQEVVSGRYISFGLYHNSTLTSLIVAERKRIGECEPEDQSLSKDPNVTVVYILSLAVSDLYRRKGLATVLLKHLISILRSVQPPPRLIYLHVLCDNLPAIFFYHKNGFRHHATLPNYYLIENSYRDGFTFVRHLNTTPIGEFLASVYDACTTFFDFLAAPFRRCINQPAHQHGGKQQQLHHQQQHAPMPGVATAAGDSTRERLFNI